MHIRTIQACPPFWLPLSNKGLQRLSCSAVVPTEKAIQKKKEKPSVSTILKRIQKAIGITFPDGREACFTGTGVHLGLAVSWRLRCRGVDGAFLEQIRGRHLNFTYGHPGMHSSTNTAQAWGVEWDDLPKDLQLDDHEALLIQAWVRTGFWVADAALKHLSIAVASKEEIPSNALKTLEVTDGRRSSLHVPEDGPSTTAYSVEDSRNSVVLSLRLKKGKVKALLWVCTKTWQPQHLSCPLCGQLDNSAYEGWNEWQTEGPSIRHPKIIVQRGGTGGNNSFVTESVQWQPHSDPASYVMPPSPVRPPDVTFEQASPPFTQAWWTASGHVLVRPCINGSDALGFFILDTGASGCVIERTAADKLGMAGFGKLFVAGMAGRIKSRFRRAETLSLGPLTIDKPLFMEMGIGGLIRGAPGPVIGIVGYDVFRRAVIELPPPSRGGLHVSVRMLMLDPEAYQPEARTAHHWQDLQMLANLPHVVAHFVRPGQRQKQGEQMEGPAPLSGLFLLDSGAGGVELMLHARAAQELQVQAAPHVRTHTLKGVGGATSKALNMNASRLPWLRLSGTMFDDVLCLAASASGGPDFSCYTQGAICAGLLSRCTTIFDYPHRRIAFLPSRPVLHSPEA
ncbi:g112 [Coccomyxa elongata]